MHGMSEEQIEGAGTDSDSGAFGAPVIAHPGKPAPRSIRKIQFDEAVTAYLKAAGKTHPTAAERAAVEAQLRKAMAAEGITIVGHHRHGRHRGVKIPKKSKIKAADFMALVTIVAQRKAGRGKVPTAGQVTTAEAVVRKLLAKQGSSVEGGEPTETMGHIKGRLLGNQMAGEGKAVSGAFWDHVKSVAKTTAPIMLPAAAIAFPVAALTARAVAKGANQGQSQKQDKSDKPEKEEPADTSGNDSKTVPHKVYRAEICRRAKVLCKGGTPTAECMAKAQASVHSEMKKSGVKVSIPGAAPGRVTAGPASSSMMGAKAK